MRHCYAPLLCAIVTWKVEQPPLLCAIVMRHLLCCVVLGLVCYLSPWMQRQQARGPGLCSEPADPRDARLGQALVEVLRAICCVAFARHVARSPWRDACCVQRAKRLIQRVGGSVVDIDVQDESQRMKTAD